MSIDFDPTDLDALSSTFSAEEKDAAALRKLMQLQSDMADTLVERFERNLEAFEKYMPEVAKTFRSYRPSETIEFFCAPNGVPNLRFVERDEILYKHINPLTLCQKQVELLLDNQLFSQVRYDYEYDWCGQIHHRYMNRAVYIMKSYKDDLDKPRLGGAVPTCIMLGCGLGYPVGMLYERIEIANLIIVEPKLDLFFASLHAFDWAPLLEFLHENHCAIYLMLGQNKEQFFDDLNHFFERHGKFLAGFFWCYIHYRSPLINELAKIIMRDYKRVYEAMGYFDDHLFALSHAAHNMLNKKELCRRDRELSPEIKQYPVFVVGNGPSLDKDINFIRKYQDKALIVACGTAIEALYRAGVQCDFYAATERIPQLEQTLRILPDQSYLDNVILLAGDVIHPYTTAMFRHTCIFSKPDEPFFWMMLGVAPEEIRKWENIVLMNPLVGNCGVSAPTMLDFKHIYLFGIDNGSKIDENMVYHSSFSSVYNPYYGAKPEAIPKIQAQHVVPGNFGGRVHAPKFYRSAIRNTELLIEAYTKMKGIEYVNCSDGALIEGARPVHSADLDADFAARPVLDKEKMRQDLITNKLYSIDVTREDIEKVLRKDDFHHVVNTLLQGLKHRPDNRLDMVQMLESFAEIITTLSDSANRHIGYVLDGSLETMFMIANYCLFHRDDPAQGLKLCNDVLDVFEKFLEDAHRLYDFLPDYCLGPHQKLCGGKIGEDHENAPAPRMPVIYDVIPKARLDAVVYTPFVKNYGDEKAAPATN